VCLCGHSLRSRYSATSNKSLIWHRSNRKERRTSHPTEVVEARTCNDQVDRQGLSFQFSRAQAISALSRLDARSFDNHSEIRGEPSWELSAPLGCSCIPKIGIRSASGGTGRLCWEKRWTNKQISSEYCMTPVMLLMSICDSKGYETEKTKAPKQKSQKTAVAKFKHARR
jgi:hypothetical protein